MQGSNTKTERSAIADKCRVVVKIGSSSLAHSDTGSLDLVKLEILVRELSDLRNSGKEVVLVSSGAIMAGQSALGLGHKPQTVSEKQACASVGQAKLMMIYQKLFSEYDQMCGQILLTKSIMLDDLNRFNARNTFRELFSLGVIPVVNENDTIATHEIDELSVFGDNDRLSAVVAALVEADLLILLSDIDGLYTDDPHTNGAARFIDHVDHLDERLFAMGKETTGSAAGTGGMATKLSAAQIATASGCDMIIASGDDFHILHEIMGGETKGTFFKADRRSDFDLVNYLEKMN